MYIHQSDMPMQLRDHSAIGYIWLTTHGRYADGEFESGTYSGGEPTGDGMRWSVDQASAYRLKDGEVVDGPPITGAQVHVRDVWSPC